MPRIWILNQPMSKMRIGDLLKKELSSPERGWTSFRAAVAFAKMSGVRHIYRELVEFAQRGSVRISVGIDMQGTSKEGLQGLYRAVTGGDGKLFVFKNNHSSNPTFHPKVFLFEGPSSCLAIVGSGNLTRGGLFTNYESVMVADLLFDSVHGEDERILRSALAALDHFSDERTGMAVEFNEGLLVQLMQRGMVLPEIQQNRQNRRKQTAGTGQANGQVLPPLFGQATVPAAPSAEAPPLSETPPESSPALLDVDTSDEEECPEPLHKGFLMTLQRTDVGEGQVTEGASKRSPEVFIPLAARDMDPGFWGWKHLFITSEKKDDRRGVLMLLDDEVILVNMMTWHVKRDLRLRNSVLRSAGEIGDILKIELVTEPAGYEYVVEIISTDSTAYDDWLAFCTTKGKGSSKKYFGYYD
jgi:HKD family nuclease